MSEVVNVVWLPYPENQPTFEGRFLVATSQGEVLEAKYCFFDATWLEPSPRKNARFIVAQGEVEFVRAFAFMPKPPSFIQKSAV